MIMLNNNLHIFIAAAAGTKPSPRRRFRVGACADSSILGASRQPEQLLFILLWI